MGIQMLSVQTDSMYPTLKPGDLIISTTVKDPSDLKVDDVITYWTVINGKKELNTHRIHAIYDQGGEPLFATKGDKHTSADPLNVHHSNVVGKYAFKIGGVGKFIDYIKDPESYGFLLIVVLPVFIFFLYYLVQFFRVLFSSEDSCLHHIESRNFSGKILLPFCLIKCFYDPIRNGICCGCQVLIKQLIVLGIIDKSCLDQHCRHFCLPQHY